MEFRKILILVAVATSSNLLFANPKGLFRDRENVNTFLRIDDQMHVETTYRKTVDRNCSFLFPSALVLDPVDGYYETTGIMSCSSAACQGMTQNDNVVARITEVSDGSLEVKLHRIIGSRSVEQITLHFDRVSNTSGD